MEMGLGYEMPCGPVDGMNPVKVAEAMTEAIEEQDEETDQHFLK
jgi:pyruvate dehydrogenase E1 component alpha subunit